MLERLIEQVIFYSRWLLAPLYLGLCLGLAILLVSFVAEFFHFFSTSGVFSSKETTLFILELIDLVLIASLVAMVAIAGYENFVSKIDFKENMERPDWMGKVDFAGLKLKVISALVAISSIELLKVFLSSSSYTRRRDTLASDNPFGICIQRDDFCVNREIHARKVVEK